ncbi:WD40/YVTN/BNR-like repeat-containing protein [Myxococcus landrumensis]|uniref:Photosynthesis system II assembly factor Ycf48/Hcf136-like domain-containing protein n=1 Tax=Myxococcus landrumensis TaxID=2813577 RepID=A0ABX7NFC7_9BACT|nr:YCF48-related protein [Myxococcus landrumus]QSQ17532.1 hypothetical protein JY572_16465 [Myxococcus landrumus]
MGLLMASSAFAEGLSMPSVDLGVREVEVREISVVSRRTDADWWAVAVLKSDFAKRWDAGPGIEEGSLPFRVYRSADSGFSWREDAAVTKAVVEAFESRPCSERSWLSSSVDFLVWYTPEVGLMAGELGSGVLRTSDAGRTWSSVALPREDALHVHDLEQAGRRTWMCGSSGHIYRSDDTGATWRELTGTPFDSEDSCTGLSFLDSERGWAAGMKGSLWATEDGGATWSRIPTSWPPTPDVFWPERPTDLEDVVLLTPEVAWVQSTAGSFQTTDGGKTWHPRLPATDYQGAVMGADTVVTVRGHLLDTFVAGRRVRLSPLTTAGSGVLSPLDGLLAHSSETWFGWTGGQVLLSYDQGMSWFAVGRVPEERLHTVVRAKDGRLFVQGPSMTLFVSRNEGRTWARSTTWLEARDFAVATGVPSEKLETPLQCLFTAPEAVVTVRFDIAGCLGGSKNHLALELSKGHATLSGRYAARQEPLEVHSRKLLREEAQSVLRGLVRAATHQETWSDCYTTTEFKTVIEWSCSPTASERQTLEFVSHGCGLRSQVDIDGGGAAATPEYDRALGVHNVAVRALEGTLR